MEYVTVVDGWLVAASSVVTSILRFLSFLVEGFAALARDVPDIWLLGRQSSFHVDEAKRFWSQMQSEIIGNTSPLSLLSLSRSPPVPFVFTKI